MSDSHEVTGSIKIIGETQSFDSGFTKREFVITTEEKYEQDIKLELVKDNCSKIDSFKVGDKVAVGFNIRGNEFNDKYYVNLVAWKLSAVAGGSTAPAASEEDLPFQQHNKLNAPACMTQVGAFKDKSEKEIPIHNRNRHERAEASQL